MMNLLFSKKNRYNKRGSVYILALIVLTTVYIILMVYLQKISFETKTLKHSFYGLQAYYVATSGMEDMIYELRKEGPGFFGAVRGWQSVGGEYIKPFPGPDVTGPQYTGTYNVTINSASGLNDNEPSTFNATIRGEREAEGTVYSRSLYVEGVWTLNKESIYITKLSEI